MKRLIGRTDVEDVLKRLDKLTHEEARMATTEILKATHTVDNRVRGVSDQVVGVDDRVAGVDDRVAGVDDRVAGLDERVRVVADKVSEAIDGTRSIFSQSAKKKCLTIMQLDGKEARAIMDEVKRLSSPNSIGSDCGCSYILQDPSHGTTFINGSLRLTRPPITTLPVLLIRRELQTGSFKAVSSQDGSQQIPIRYFGFMANMRPTLPASHPLMKYCTCSRLGQKHPLVRNMSLSK